MVGREWLHRGDQPSHITPPPHVCGHSQLQLQATCPIRSQVSMHTTSPKEPFLWHSPNRHSEPAGSSSASGQVSLTPLAAVKDMTHLYQHHFRPLPLHYLLPHLSTPLLPPPRHTLCCPTPSTPLKHIRMLARCVCSAAQAVCTLADSVTRCRHAPTAAHVVAVTAGCPWQQLAGSRITAPVGPGTDVEAKVALFPLPDQAVSAELLRCF